MNLEQTKTGFFNFLCGSLDVAFKEYTAFLFGLQIILLHFQGKILYYFITTQ